MSPTAGPLTPLPGPSVPHPAALTLPSPGPGLAGGCLLLLMLTAAVLRRTRAAPVPGPPCVLPKARVCDMAQFKSLAPRELQAFKTARDAFVSLPSSLWSSLAPWGLTLPPSWQWPSSLPAGASLHPVCCGLSPALAALG